MHKGKLMIGEQIETYPRFRGIRLWIWKYKMKDDRKNNKVDVLKMELKMWSIHGVNLRKSTAVCTLTQYLN